MKISIREAVAFTIVACLLTTQAHSADNIREVNIGGYLSVGHGQAPESFNMGFSFYTAAWPLVEKYQGHRFQSGLYGTWMFSQYDGPAPDKLYSDIEGGLGWWTDTRFPTETPKFIMGGVGPNFSAIANGPAHGAGDWNEPHGLYGVAQLSPFLLFPINGLNLRQGACGQLFGYGYLALPLTPAKATTDGANVPTGDHSWTLFLSTEELQRPRRVLHALLLVACDSEESRMGRQVAGLPPEPAEQARLDGDSVCACGGIRRRERGILPAHRDHDVSRGCGWQLRGDASCHRLQQGGPLERCETMV